MCLNQQRFCECGGSSAFLLFRDNLLGPEVLVHLYCPECRGRALWDGARMLADCGWVLEFDLERARALFDVRGVRVPATPEHIFDEGYLTWQGFSPGDHEVNTRLHQRLAPLIEQDLALYLKSLKEQWLEHVARLKAAGWRKAQQA
jgi:hypothetical protein